MAGLGREKVFEGQLRLEANFLLRGTQDSKRNTAGNQHQTEKRNGREVTEQMVWNGSADFRLENPQPMITRGIRDGQGQSHGLV